MNVLRLAYLPMLGALVVLAASLALPARPALGASFVVDTTADDPGIALQCSGAPGDCSLRGAITRANLSSEGDVITFSVSGTISIASALPALTAGGDTIDGSSASILIQGAEGQTFPCVVLSSAGNTVKALGITDCSHGIDLSAASSDNNTLGPGVTIFDTDDGIHIGDASATGNSIIGNKLGTNAAGTAIPAEGGNIIAVTIYGSGNTVGGTAVADRNIISGNGVGIYIPAGGTGNAVYGNFIGTDVTGTVDLGNLDSGVEVRGTSNTIGGLLAGQRNLISGNDTSNIYLTGGGGSNTIQGNIIGPTINGAGTLSNIDGVDITFGSSGNTIGPGNVISDNVDGVFIAGIGTSGNVIKGNLIGTDLAGVAALPNSNEGIEIGFSAGSNTVGGVNPGDGNVIAFNARNGVLVNGASSTGITVRGNSIYSNGLAGIANLNGGNQSLTPPTVVSVGSAAGTSCASCIVDVYSDDVDEGRVYHGSTVADGSGAWSFGGVVAGPYITATATNAAGSTSQFSAPYCLDSDGDSVCNAVDADDDNDGFTDVAEAGTPLCSNGVNDDSPDDGVADDGCPGGPAQAGAYSEAQFNIGTGPQDPCGNDGWPADLVSAGLSTNKLTLQDITSFLAPAYLLNTSPGDTNFSARWDLVPGKGIFAKFINLQDLTAIIPSTTASTARPPMFSGAPAMNQTCPYPP